MLLIARNWQRQIETVLSEIDRWKLIDKCTKNLLEIYGNDMLRDI